MKSWEMEELARKQGYAEGHDEGYSEGHDEGYSDGFNNGFNNGTAKGNQEMQEKMNQLIISLTKANRTEEILKSAHDKAYQEELFKEFHL